MAYLFQRKTGWVLIDKREKRWVTLGKISTSEAKQILRRYESEQTYLRLDIAPKKSDMTVRELCDLYIEDIAGFKGAYTVDRESRLLRHFCKTFGDWDISDLSAETIERYLKKKGYRAYSAHNVVKSIRGAFKLGCLRKFVNVNPAMKVRLPKLEKLPPRAPDPKIVELVLGKMSGQIRAFYEILRFTGMRPGEAIGLQAKDIQEDIIIVRAPKTKDFRAIPIHPKLRSFLKVLTKNKVSDDWLFPGQNGGHQMSMKMGLRRALQTIKEETKGKLKIKLSAYDLRHGFATQVLRKSNLRAVQTLLGHARSTTTERYAHALADDLKKAVRAI